MPTPRGYTQVVEVTSGRMIFISGQVALDAAGNMVGAAGLILGTVVLLWGAYGAL